MEARRILYSLGIVLMLVLCGCEREEMDPQNGGSSQNDPASLVSVPCNLKVVSFGSDTCALEQVKGTDYYTDHEKQIKDFWLIQFNGDGKLLASTYHASDLLEKYVSMNNDVNDGKKNINETAVVWIIANTGDSEGLSYTNLNSQLSVSRVTFGMNDKSDLEVFEQDGYKFTTDAESDLMPLNRASSGGILMSGKCSFSATDMYDHYPDGTPNYDQAKKALEVTLSPMVAKLNIQYTLNGFEKDDLVSIRFYRIPDRVSFSPESITTTVYRQLSYEFKLPESAYDGNMTMYVPQNIQPKPAFDGEWTAATKTINAPAKASYISFELASGDDKVNVNVFPGGNIDGATDASYDNYEIKANTFYIEKITINKSTITSYLEGKIKDDRIIEKLQQKITSNCYILNPLTSVNATGFNYSANREEYYSLPIIARSNEAWYGIDPSKVIDEDDEWKVEVVWQDVPGRQVFFLESSGLKGWKNEYGFIENKGSDDDNNLSYATEYYGKGNGDDGYVNIFVKKETAINNRTDADRTEGNVLIALRKKIGDSYGDILWSWHLWVTDYNPDKIITSGNNYAIVPGSADNNNTLDAKIVKYAFWVNGSCSWIMDRHLGALDWRPEGLFGNSKYDAYGLYYQWGRKDPFPGRDITDNGMSLYGNLNLYGIDGNSIGNNIISSGTYNTIDALHNNPTNIANDYAGLTNQNNWNAPNSGASTTVEFKAIHGTKTLYDPCPVGWEVPESVLYHGNGTGFVTVTTYESGGTIYASHVNDKYALKFYEVDVNPASSQANLNNGGWEISASGSGTDNTGNPSSVSGSYANATPDNTSTFFPCSGFINSNTKDMQGIGDIWCADSKNANSGGYVYIGRGTTGSGENVAAANPTIHIITKDSKGYSEYFNKRYAFSVRCVKK